MSEINGSEQQSSGQQTAPEASSAVPPKREYFTKRQTLLVGASTVVAACLGVGGVFAVQDVATAVGSAFGTHAAAGGSTSQGAAGLGGPFGYGSPQLPQQQLPQTGEGDTGYSDLSAATSAQSKGIVLIDTQLGYESAEAAGTGIVLTSSGEIVTNNHVIEGATAIRVEVVATGTTYTAKVVGDDASDDIAVLQLQGASGLTTAKLDTKHTVAVGDAVTGVGNAEGAGSLAAASGKVTGLGQSITTQAEGSSPSEDLHGLIETNAAIQPGDSGGPLYDADGKIVGIDVAASSSGAADSYAIPLSTALSIAKQIENGDARGDVRLGYPAFLGVELGADAASGGAGDGSFSGNGFSGNGLSGNGFSGNGFGDGSTGSTVSGATIAGVTANGPAEEAGLVAGDTITAIDGTTVASTTDLQTALAAHRPGDKVAVTWTDADGASHTASVTLTQGPAA